jgi:hopanoid biosynthesis associated protein HpnK
MMRSLIVTGDDFGASPGVNAAIVRAHDEGILTGASLLVTGECASQAAVLARQRPQLATGLHLALCDANSASPPGAIPDLVTPDGRFPALPGRTGIAHWIWRRRRREQLEKEIRAQVERYLETGLPLDHVDGHHHLHMHPVVFDILLRCMEAYKIPWVRLVDEDRRARRRGDPLLGEVEARIFGLLAAHHRRALTRRGAAFAPDRVYGLRATDRLDLQEWLRLLPRIRSSTVEVYTHPDADTDNGRRQLEALCAPKLRSAVEAAGYRLIGSRESALGKAGGSP